MYILYISYLNILKRYSPSTKYKKLNTVNIKSCYYIYLNYIEWWDVLCFRV